MRTFPNASGPRCAADLRARPRNSRGWRGWPGARVWRHVSGDAIVVDRAAGCRLWDADGNSYLDYVCSWGTLILGHAHAEIVAAVAEQAARGTSYGMTAESEVELASMIRNALPSLERVRFVSSGNQEATMKCYAFEAQRGHWARPDREVRGLLSRPWRQFSLEGWFGAGHFLALRLRRECRRRLQRLTLDAPYNDLAAVERIFAAHPDGIAAVIIEPVAANIGVVLPAPRFFCAVCAN